MKVLIAGCSLAGLSTALGLVTKFEENKKRKACQSTGVGGHDDGDKHNDDAIEIVIVERRPHLDSRGATFGLARNGQLALKEIAPPQVLQELTDELGIYMEFSGGYMLPWWKVRDVLMRCVLEESPYKEAISLHLGCVVKDVLEDENMRNKGERSLKISFEAAISAGTDTVADSGGICHTPFIPSTQEFDLLIGADGVHSQIRTQVLQCPPPVPTDTRVWRGSVDTTSIPKLHHLQNNPVGKIVSFGENIILAYFNFHSKLPGTIAWVLSCQNMTQLLVDSSIASDLTPDKLIKDYQESLAVDDPQRDDDSKFQDALLVFANTHDPSDLTWSTEMAVVDLESPDYCKADTNRWGGRGRITLVGDAAHSLRPASGLGGSLAFEDAAVLSRCVFENRATTDAAASTNSLDTLSQRLARFEALRLPRCQSLSRDQTWRSTLSYQVGFANVPQWDPQYRDWILEGPDASPHPPVDERAVFGSLLP